LGVKKGEGSNRSNLYYKEGLEVDWGRGTGLIPIRRDGFPEIGEAPIAGVGFGEGEVGADLF